MTLNNLAYLYDHLPARMRRDDAGLFLKRFLSFFGETLDGHDLQLDTFYQKIDPQTAPQQFIDWWLYTFFGWGWFPTWFTDERRRAFYAGIAQHYAQRGTFAGIKNFLSVFGLRVIVEGEPRFYGEEVYGESVWSVTGPLGFVVRIFPEAPAVSEDLEYFDEAFFGEAYGNSPGLSIQRADVDELLRFQWPLAQFIFIEDLPFSSPPPPGEPLTYGSAEYGEAIPG
ncbi:MAG TPA: phage tail protein [Pyrinomonadaceae bacterium]|nr:phage tail protein [Pyrinomonadaceae bacterium]